MKADNLSLRVIIIFTFHETLFKKQIELQIEARALRQLVPPVNQYFDRYFNELKL